jgi:hypothetical protein
MATCPLFSTWDPHSSGDQKIMIRSFTISNVPFLRASKTPNPDCAMTPIPYHAFGTNNFDYRDITLRDIAVPGAMVPLSSETPKCRIPTLLDPRTRILESTVPISSENRGSRFRCARVSCFRKPRCSGSRLPQISCQVSYRDQRLWFHRCFETQEVSDLSTSKYLMPSIPDDLARLQPLHIRINPSATPTRSDGWWSFASSFHESQSSISSPLGIS